MLNLLRTFPDAFLCGIVMAAVCGAVGVFVVLRRIVFVSVAVSEAATCGVAVGLALHASPFLGPAAATALALVLLELPVLADCVPREVRLAAVFLFASSLSILLVAQNGFGLEEVKAMLYGDLFLCEPADVRRLLLAGVPALLILLAAWRPLAYTFFDREGSEVMGIRCRFWKGLYAALLWAVIAGTVKSGGALLVFCDLVLPSATVLLFARQILPAILGSACLGMAETTVGLLAACRWDFPANPLLIALACAVFALGLAAKGMKRRKRVTNSNLHRIDV